MSNSRELKTMIKLVKGDCLTAMNEIEDQSIDLVCCDMPYGTTQCKWDSVINLEKLWPELERVSKPNTAIVLFAQTPFDKVLGCSNLPLLKYEWIWEKPAATGFFNAKKMPMKAHENILVFYKKLPVYNFTKTTGHERKTASRFDHGSEVYGKAVKKTNYDSTERYPRSVQVFSSDKQRSKLHPTQKPLALLEYIIKTYSNEGDHVLDFASGSFTTGVACINLNRKFIGIEINKNYFDIGVNRIKERIKCLDSKIEPTIITGD